MNAARRRRHLGKHTNVESEPFLVFEVGGEDYALSLLSVSEVVRPDGLEATTDAPRALRGVMRLRDRRLAVLDLAAALGTVSETTPDTCVLVTEDEERGVTRALAVDRVQGLVQLDATAVVGVPKVANVFEVDFIAALATLERGLVPILDLPRVLDLEPLRDAFHAAQNRHRGGAL